LAAAAADGGSSGHYSCLFLQGSAAAELGCSGKFKSVLGRRQFLSTALKESLSLDSNYQNYGKKLEGFH